MQKPMRVRQLSMTTTPARYSAAWKRERIRAFRADKEYGMVASYLWWLYGFWLAPTIGVSLGLVCAIAIIRLVA